MQKIHRDKNGKIIYDKSTKDIEIIKFQKDVEEYMQEEVLPYTPDAKWFFEEDAKGKNPKYKIGAEFPFTRYFYEFNPPSTVEEFKTEMKESGIEWVGKIPKEWTFERLKNFCDLENGYSFNSEDYVNDSDTLCCRMSNIRPDGSFDILYSATYLPDDFAKRYKKFILKDNDIIVAMTDMAGDPKILGVPTKVDTQGYTLLLNQRVGKITLTNEKVTSDFLRYAMASESTKMFYKVMSDKNVQINIGKEDILNIKIPIPSIEEQQEIVNYLDGKCTEIDNAINEKRAEIEKLEKYKESLIYEYATGKKIVKGEENDI